MMECYWSDVEITWPTSATAWRRQMEPAVKPALRALAELGAAFYALSLVLSHHGLKGMAGKGTQALQTVVVCATAAVVVRVVARAVSAFFTPATRETTAPPSFYYERWLAGLGIVHAVGLAGLNSLVHEWGHCAAAKWCYWRSSPEITLQPFKGGSTSYTDSYGLTPFGELLGDDRAAMLCSAGGVVASTATAMGELALARHLDDSDPTAARCLRWHAISLLAADILYGLSAFSTHADDVGHDFIALWKVHNVHPYVILTAMVALPSLQIVLGLGPILK